MRSFASKLSLAALLIAAPLSGALASDNPNSPMPWENGGITSYGTDAAGQQNVDLTRTGSISVDSGQTLRTSSPVPFSSKSPLDQD